jgi:predicted ATPase
MDLLDPARLPPLEEIADNEAIRLFCVRARAAKPDFELTEETAEPIAAVCQRLDGLPLAIELAAARSALFEPAELLARLDRRLPMLTGGVDDVPERLRAMRAAIAWSYDLLDDAERALFHRLAVFAGGFSLDAAQTVASGLNQADALDRLASLLDKSLIKKSGGAPAGETRFFMLETIREFGLEQLAASGNEDGARRAHVDVCERMARDEAPLGAGREERAWLDRLELNQANLRAALDWLETIGDERRLIELSGSLWLFWYVHAHFGEARRRFGGVLERGVELEPLQRASVFLALGWVAHHADEIQDAIANFTESRDCARRAGI